MMEGKILFWMEKIFAPLPINVDTQKQDFVIIV